jgi:hypothetical protein
MKSRKSISTLDKRSVRPGRGAAGEPQKQIRFVSLKAATAIDDYDIIKGIAKSNGFEVDFFEFKVTNTKTQKRLINTAQRNGPKERIRIEEKIDVNSNYKYLRQVSWRVLKEENNIFLVQMNQVKGVPCSLPLIFPDIFKANRTILVSGITYQLRAQLLSKVDLDFKSIADPINNDQDIRRKILERAEREKTMQAIARELQDFYGIPVAVKEKLTRLAVGEKVLLSDEEAVNIILLSDLYTRYLPLFHAFQKDISSKNASVSALASQFADMTIGIETEELIDAFRDYLMGDDDETEAFASETNGQLFGFLYKKAQQIDDKRVKIGDFPLTRSEMFSIMRSLITTSRSQHDPGLWEGCRYFYRYDDLKTSKKENSRTVETLLEKIFSQMKLHHSASSLSLLEIHLIHNIHRYISGRRVLVSKAELMDIELNVIHSAVIPTLYQPGDEKSFPQTIRLFLGIQANFQQLINPIHTVGRVYGFLMGRRLREAVQRFLKPGLRDLLERFGRNFFNIFYEMTVLEAGIPISRNSFAQWLESKGYFKDVKKMGYIPNEIESNFDPLLTPKVLMEAGDSCFPKTYSEADYTSDYEKARNGFIDFSNNIQKDGTGFGKLLANYLKKGKYNPREVAFREAFRKSQVYLTLKNLVVQSCVEIKFKLLDLAIANKIVIKIPIEFEPLLLLENIFLLSIENQDIQLHLIAVPVESDSHLDKLSAVFSKTLRSFLSRGGDAKIKELVRAIRILRVYQNVYTDFVKHVSISVIDRQINNTILKIRQQKNQTPNHIKYHFENFEKMFVGNFKGLNLGKLVQYDAGKKAKDTFYTLSTSQILQGIVLHKSALYKLRDYRSIIDRIQGILELLSQSRDEDYNSITYSKQIQKFDQLISVPIEEFNSSYLNIITILAKKIKKSVVEGNSKNHALSKLYAEWKRLNPEQEMKIDFYSPFLREDDSGYEQKLFLEISKAREVLMNIMRRNCLVFFPDKSQEDQLRFIAEIGSFMMERKYDVKTYVEISRVEKEQIEELSRVFYPGNFFRLERIKPVKPLN